MLELSQLSPSIKVFLVSMLPVGELRAGIPLGISYGLSAFEAYFASVAGNIAPIAPILIFLGVVEENLIKKVGLFDNLFQKIVERAREKSKENIKKYGAVGLITFVAVPLPATGAWTGALVAHVFGLEKKQAFFCIALGVVIAGVIVSVFSLGVFSVSSILAFP